MNRANGKAQTLQNKITRIAIIAVGAVIVGVIGLEIYTALYSTSSSDLTFEGIESQPLPENGDPSLLENVASFPSEGQEHVPQDESVPYGTNPPTSGQHYGSPAPPGFYERPAPYGNLVHSLEHGAVVLYYDQEMLTQDEVKESLEAFGMTHQHPWASFIAVPKIDPQNSAPFVLTAWTKMLELKEYDPSVIQSFLAEYIGRGPENRVR